VIGVDCDGVLASDRLLWQLMRQRFPKHIAARYEDLESFEWPRATNETTALCLELSADPLFMALLEPMPRMVRALCHLRDSGYRIHVITARPECVRRATWRWLRRQGVAEYVDNVHCVAGGPAKVPLARKLGCAAFVEDNHATAEALGAAGIRSYLLDAPYNQVPTEHSIRMRGWRAVLDDLMLHVPARQPALSVHTTRRLRDLATAELAS
jgi:uncharacterized HAD superfamily protein